jgi:hypothetical protein
VCCYVIFGIETGLDGVGNMCKWGPGWWVGFFNFFEMCAGMIRYDMALERRHYLEMTSMASH